MKQLIRLGQFFIISMAMLWVSTGLRAQQVDVRTNLDGILNIVWGDPHRELGAGETMLYSLTLPDKTTVPLQMAGQENAAVHLFRKRVSVSGRLVPNRSARPNASSPSALVVDTITPVSVPQALAPAAATVFGTKKVIYLLLKFADDNAVPHPPSFYTNLNNPDTPPAGEVFPATVNGFFRKTSWNQFSWIGDVGGLGGIGAPAGWLTLPHPKSHYAPCGWSSACADLQAIGDDGMAVGRAQGIDFKSYDNINFVLSNDLDCCAWGGGYYNAVDAKSYGATWEPPWGQEAGTYAHEMGHSLGLPHSGWVYHAYDSPWDMMSKRGSATSVLCGSYASMNSGATSNLFCSEPGNGYIAAHKDYLGWIPAANQVVTNTGASPNLTVTLEADALPLGSSIKMIKICLSGLPCTGSSARYFTVEARVGRLGAVSQYDNSIPGDGIIIHEFQGDRAPIGGTCYFNSQSGWALPIDTTPNDYDSVNCREIGTYPEYALSNAQLSPGEVYSNSAYGFSVAVVSQAASTFVVAVSSSSYTITLNASPSAGGAVGGAGTYAAGSSRTVTATANNGYTFANWTENGAVVSTTASYTFALNTSRNLFANFTVTPATHTITVSASPSAGGIVGGAGTYAAGSSRTVTATANNGYTFANWTANGIAVSTTASYTFTLSASRTLVANFTATPATYTITLSALPLAGGTLVGAGTYAAGSSRTVIATASSGYMFANWTENGTVVSTAASYAFSVNANRSLVAVFTAIRHTANDFNGDGKADILFRNSDSTLATVLMDGTLVVSVAQMAGKPAGWSVVEAGDFNGDGKADILWRHTDGSVEMWLMNGAAIISTVSLGARPTSSTIAGSGDINGDGKADILWRNADGSVEMWLMNGAAITSAVSVGVRPTSTAIAATGDFNGDGKADILWRNADGSVEMWFMNGTAIASTGVVGAVPLSWSVDRVGDFNGDGMADILWRNADGSVAISLLNGASITGSVVLAVVPLSWSVAGTGDFNGDGKADILWRNVDGSVAMLLMNGTAVTSNADFGVVSTSWTIVP